MNKRLERSFLKALEAAIATPSDVAAGMGKAYRTLRSYQDGSRRVTLDAAKSLSQYLRRQANAMLKAADKLDSLIEREEDRNG
jgi:hypothetical protein